MKVLPGISKFTRDRYVWYIAILLGIIAIYTFLVEQVLFGKTLEESDWHPVYMAIRNFMFLGVVFLSAWRFGFKGGLAVGLAIGLVELPHVVTEVSAGEHRIDNLIEFAIFAPVGVLIAWLVGTRRRVEEKLVESEEKFRSLAEYSPNMIFINKAGRIVYANRRCEEITGYKREELYASGFDFMTLIAPKDRGLVMENFRRHMASEEIPPYDYPIITRDGRQLDVILSTKLIDYERGKAIVCIITDVTERKKVQEQLMAQDRLASIGQLVSGIAHEINNPLTSVIGFSDLLLQRDLPDDVKDDLKIVHDEAKRTGRIVRNLLTFVRKEPEGKMPVDVNEVILAVLNLRSHEQSINNIKAITNFASELPKTMGNASQLQQVFFNLIVNAEQAMLEAHNRGTLTITTGREDNIVKARFADDGPGISPENMRRLFTPFFTTKGIGKGTGLGLSICHGIITEHGGKVYAESEPGKGATFIVELPVIPKQATAEESAG